MRAGQVLLPTELQPKKQNPDNQPKKQKTGAVRRYCSGLISQMNSTVIVKIKVVTKISLHLNTSLDRIYIYTYSPSRMLYALYGESLDVEETT